MDVNFEYYKIFYYVAKYGNITKAATALGSSQPNVTRVMKLLESQLNCRLFVREARGICLTEEGERLYSHVEIACRHLLDAQEELFRRDSLEGGMVEIGATETALHLFLMSALREFRRECPMVRIRIHNQSTPETVRQLLGGKLDFAVITGPFELPKTVFAEMALEFEEILVGGKQYEFLSETLFQLEDLRRHAWVGLGRGSATHAFYRDFFIRRGIDLEPEMEVATSDLMLPLIENNFGIGFVPKDLARPLLEEKKIVQIRLDCEIPKRSIQIVSDLGREKSLAAATLYRYLRNRGESA